MKSKLSFLLAVVIVVGVFSQCQPPPSINNAILDSFSKLPEGEFAFAIGLRPADMINSELFKRIEAELTDEDWEAFKSEMVEKTGAALTDIKTVTFAMAMPNLFMTKAPAMVANVEAPFDTEKIKADIEKENPGIAVETRTHEGVDYWAFQQMESTQGVAMTDAGMFAGGEETVISSIDLLKGKGKSIMGNKAVREALNMMHPDAMAVFAFWDFKETMSPILSMFAGFATKESDKEMLKQLGELKTVVVSIRMDDAFLTEGSLLFASEDACRSFESYYRELLEKAPAQYQEQMDQLGVETIITPETMEDLVNNVEISRSGSLLKISSTIPGDSPVWDEFIADMKARKAEQAAPIEENQLEMSEDNSAESEQIEQ